MQLFLRNGRVLRASLTKLSEWRQKEHRPEFRAYDSRTQVETCKDRKQYEAVSF